MALHGHTNLPLIYDTFVDQVTFNGKMKSLKNENFKRKNERMYLSSMFVIQNFS